MLTGQREKGDYLNVGSAEWLVRWEENDQHKLEAIDEAARAELCLATPDVMEWSAPSGKRFIWLCATCTDGEANGDESDVDCRGSCNRCVLPPEPEPEEEAWDPSIGDTEGQVDQEEAQKQANGTAFFMEASYNSQTNGESARKALFLVCLWLSGITYVQDSAHALLSVSPVSIVQPPRRRVTPPALGTRSIRGPRVPSCTTAPTGGIGTRATADQVWVRGRPCCRAAAQPSVVLWKLSERAPTLGTSRDIASTAQLGNVSQQCLRRASRERLRHCQGIDLNLISSFCTSSSQHSPHSHHPHTIVRTAASHPAAVASPQLPGQHPRRRRRRGHGVC